MIVNTKENREDYIKRADDRVQLFMKSLQKFGDPVSVLNVNWNDEDVFGFVFAGPMPCEQAEDDAAWDEAERRMDAIGQNGNDGAHYSVDEFKSDLDKIEDASKAEDAPEGAKIKVGVDGWRLSENWMRTESDLYTLNGGAIGGSVKILHAETAVRTKYHVEIKGVWVDVYDVLKAFDVTCPALQHLIKKALKAGNRGHKTTAEDLADIVASAKRAEEMGQ